MQHAMDLALATEPLILTKQGNAQCPQGLAQYILAPAGVGRYKY